MIAAVIYGAGAPRPISSSTFSVYVPGESVTPAPVKEVFFVIPLTPPSVNHYKNRARNGHYFVTKLAKDFKNAVWVCSARQKIRASAYEVEAKIMLGKGQKGDLDNFSKCLLDGLVDAGVIDSDAKITRLILSKDRTQSDPWTSVTIRGL